MFTAYLISVFITLLLVQAALYVATTDGQKFTTAQVVASLIIAFLPVINLVIIFKAFTTKK